MATRPFYQFMKQNGETGFSVRGWVLFRDRLAVKI